MILDPRVLVGMEKEEAIEIITLNNLLWRITQTDGLPHAVTRDHREDRIDLHLENGYICHAYIG